MSLSLSTANQPLRNDIRITIRDKGYVNRKNKKIFPLKLTSQQSPRPAWTELGRRMAHAHMWCTTPTPTVSKKQSPKATHLSSRKVGAYKPHKQLQNFICRTKVMQETERREMQLITTTPTILYIISNAIYSSLYKDLMILLFTHQFSNCD